MIGSFHGGVHPPDKKDKSLLNPIRKMNPPDRVIIPLIQHIGAPAAPCVKVGDSVCTGSLIGMPDGFISSAVHASISGTVKRIDMFPHPVLGMAPAVMIESDGKDTLDPSIHEVDVLSYTAEDIIACVKACGIVGLGGAAFPAHVKLSPPETKPIDTIVINGAECEPYLTCDHMTMLFSPLKVLRGAAAVTKAVGATRCIIGIEDNKMDAIELLKSKVRSEGFTNIEVEALHVKYPQGAEKQLIYALTKREVPAGGLPMDIGIVVHNVGTVAAIQDALRYRKPLYERLVTVVGTSLRASYNMSVRIGTSFEDVIAATGGLLSPPKKMIMGGPMMGIAQERFDVPVIKGTSGILLFNKVDFDLGKPGPCIRCGRCVDICPMHLVPSALSIFGEREAYEDADGYNVNDCMECGACTYVCPAKRPIVHIIKKIKHVLRQKK